MKTFHHPGMTRTSEMTNQGSQTQVTILTKMIIQSVNTIVHHHLLHQTEDGVDCGECSTATHAPAAVDDHGMIFVLIIMNEAHKVCQLRNIFHHPVVRPHRELNVLDQFLPTFMYEIIFLPRILQY